MSPLQFFVITLRLISAIEAKSISEIEFLNNYVLNQQRLTTCLASEAELKENNQELKTKITTLTDQLDKCQTTYAAMITEEKENNKSTYLDPTADTDLEEQEALFQNISVASQDLINASSRLNPNQALRDVPCQRKVIILEKLYDYAKSKVEDMLITMSAQEERLNTEILNLQKDLSNQKVLNIELQATIASLEDVKTGTVPIYDELIGTPGFDTALRNNPTLTMWLTIPTSILVILALALFTYLLHKCSENNFFLLRQLGIRARKYVKRQDKKLRSRIQVRLTKMRKAKDSMENENFDEDILDPSKDILKSVEKSIIKNERKLEAMKHKKAKLMEMMPKPGNSPSTLPNTPTIHVETAVEVHVADDNNSDDVVETAVEVHVADDNNSDGNNVEDDDNIEVNTSSTEKIVADVTAASQVEKAQCKTD